MLFHARPAAPPLHDSIEMLWYAEVAPQPHDREALMPIGTVELIFNLLEDSVRVYDRRDITRCVTLPGAIVVGVASEFMVIDTAEQASVLGVHFRPGGAFPFLGLPASEVRDLHVALEDLWGNEARLVRERLLAAETIDAKFDVIEDALLARFRRAQERHAAVAFALACMSRGTKVAQITDRVGLSSRRFIDVFSNEVGLTPKLYSRVERFQRVLRRVHGCDDVDWSDVALACGYYDQPHLIRDFRAFSGFKPSEYLARRTAHLNHVPLSS